MIYLRGLIQKKKGFTIVEMLITVVIFSVVVGAVTAVLVSAIRLQRYNLIYQQLLDQTSYATEYLSRLVRMAKEDTDGDCVSAGTTYYKDNYLGNDYFVFEDYRGYCRTYWIQDGELYEWREDTRMSLPLIKSNYFEVKSLKVNISGDVSGQQPKLTFFMKIEGTGLSPQPKIQIQTTVSQRNLNE